jgi:hypothetical protein
LGILLFATEGFSDYTGNIQVYGLDQHGPWQQPGACLEGYQPSQTTGNTVSLSLAGKVLVGQVMGMMLLLMVIWHRTQEKLM